MERIRHGLDITKEYLGHIKELVEDKDFKGNLDKAGSVAAMISLGIRLYEQASEKAKTEDEKVFSSLIKFTFDCVEYTLSGNKNISINNIKSKEIQNHLFNIFVNTKEGLKQGIEDPYWNSYYLPSHPTIREFKKLFIEILVAEGHRNLVQDFILDFNIYIEEKTSNVDNREDFSQSLHMKHKNELLRHLECTSTMLCTCNPIDNKPLAQYYVENNAIIADIFETWDKEDTYFSTYIDEDSKELKASNVVMKSVTKKARYGEDNNRYTLVAAPFGIGKTSLAIYIAATCASRYLGGKDLFDDDSNGNSSEDYIPVFVSLKDVNDDNGIYIERILRSIFSFKEAKKKILLICDGLDEYRFEGIKLKQVLYGLSTEDKYPNIKFLITTRLELGLQKLHPSLIKYIRLLPFNRSQVNEFFKRYGLPQYSFEKISRYGLGDEEKRKPLFCWMIALNPNSERFLLQSVPSSKRYYSYLTMALLYQDFIHSLISARYKKIAKEFSDYYFDEKNLLRKIAALKQAYESIEDILTVDKLIAGLRDYYGLDYTATSVEREKIFNAALISYFYLSGQNTRDKTIDFIHKSFKEHLLAEYYIESMLDYNNKHYLNVGMPSDQTIQHLEGLLEIVNNEDEYLKKQTDNFIMSLKNQHQYDCTMKGTLVKNAIKIFENEEIIIFQPNKKKGINQKNDGMGWNTIYTPAMKYRELWIHRWLSLYILNALAPKNKIDKTILSNFITNTSHTMPSSLKRLTNIDLSDSDLSGADLHKANLSESMFKGTDLSFTNLSGADLSNVHIIESDLSGADLVETNLSKATLSKTNLSGTNLSGTNLSGAKLSLLLLRDVKILNLELDENTLFNNTLTNVPELVEFIESDQRINLNISITPIGYNQIAIGELKTEVSQVKGIRKALREELQSGGYDDNYIDEIFKLDPLWVISSDNGFILSNAFTNI